MGALGVIICFGGFGVVLWDFLQHLPRDRRPGFSRWIAAWVVKGLLTPIVLWIAVDGGLIKCYPTFTPAVEYALAGAHRFLAMEIAFHTGWFIIATYWGAVTCAWLLYGLRQRTDSPQDFKGTLMQWSIFLVPCVALAVWFFGWANLGVASMLGLLPILQRVLNLEPEPANIPIYSQALAKLQFDKHAEAETAVLEELEKSENDFEGWLMLADLYANHFHDLPGAEAIIHQTCDHPETTPPQVAMALHRLADWHLRLAEDPEGARRAVEEICQRFPNSHLDKMARLRLGQIPGNKEELIQTKTPRKVALGPVQVDSHALALARAKECVGQLQSNPDDMAARETLARIYADELGAVDPALEQLQMLTTMPDAPAGKVASWLALMASWLVKYKNDAAAAQKIWEQILEQYPKTQEGYAARSQLGLMKAKAMGN